MHLAGQCENRLQDKVGHWPDPASSSCVFMFSDLVAKCYPPASLLPLEHGHSKGKMLEERENVLGGRG